MGLVLKRRVGQTIVINGDIRVTLHEICSMHWAKIEVEAPREVPVHRSEIQLRVDAGKTEGGTDDE